MANTPTPNNRLHLESLDRIGSIPLIETSIKRAEYVYSKVKQNNRLFNWYFETAEATIFAAYDSVQPALGTIFEAPLRRLDNVMCKSLDILEQRIPLVYLPPEMMYWNTKEYMSDRLVKPVLKRADSMKQIGTAVLENPLTTYAADRIDGAFTAGDKFVDKYLIAINGEQDQTDAPNEEENAANEFNEKGAIKAIHHGQRLSRKLKRHLTQRTIAEARALGRQSREAINVLIYAAELIATDPKMAYQKFRELWEYLSQDEPENQARPVTFEQLIVLLTRESARRVVHLVNYGTNVASQIPKTVAHTSTEVAHHIIYLNSRIIRITKFEQLKQISKEEAESIINRMISFYSNLQGLTNNYLERLAAFLSGRIEAEKVPTIGSSTTTARRRINPQESNSPAAHNNINGVY